MVFFTYPLQLFVSVDIIKSYFPPSKSTDAESFLDDALLKSLLVFLTCKFLIWWSLNFVSKKFAVRTFWLIVLEGKKM